MGLGKDDHARLKVFIFYQLSGDERPEMKRGSKYGAKPTVVDGVRFASMKEARRYSELKLLEKAGKIHDLVLQPSYDLEAKRGGKVGIYRADFMYCTCHADPFCEGFLVVEDVKGFKTPLYRWKKRHVEAQYGITIREI